MRKLQDSVVKKLVKCLDQGIPIREVAEIIGTSPTIVQKYKKQHQSGELTLIENEANELCRKLDLELERKKEKYLEKVSDMVTQDMEKLASMQTDDLETLNAKYEVIGKAHKVGKDIFNIGNSGTGLNVNVLSAVKVDKQGNVETN